MTDPQPPTDECCDEKPEVVEQIVPDSEHLRLTQVTLRDQTDLHDELVFEQSWLLHPREGEMELRGNLFVIESLVRPRGWICVKQGPLPHVRTWWNKPDLRLRPQSGHGFEFELLDEEEDGEHRGWQVLEFGGGDLERTRRLHDWQGGQRPDTDAHRLPRFLTNTWGDRSQDARLGEEFALEEIRTASRLGADVFQLDDGWQKGITGNSAWCEELGGRSENFREADPDFWTPHPERFPNGLQPVIKRAERTGLEVGLWFAPDPGNEHANWEQDADRIVRLHREHGVRFFKIDGTITETKKADANLNRFFRKVLADSNGEICMDFDVTHRNVRPGYLGALEAGPVFVENRYTDWHGYWPHHTLRNLWQLCRWIDPRRLRMEFLNKDRNLDLYADDPLAPVHYPPDTLFATVMFANPLGWFETSQLPESYFETVTPLVELWKTHREELFSGTILPIGAPPDGIAFTGFVSVSEDRDRGLGVVFREGNPRPSATIDVSSFSRQPHDCKVLAGDGECKWAEGELSVSIPEQFGYLFFRFATS